MTLAAKLAKGRKKQRLSMSEVSRMSVDTIKATKEPRCQVTQGYISRLESGKEKNPSYIKLKTLCKIYKIQPGSLF